jgi:hypothetical protein
MERSGTEELFILQSLIFHPLVNWWNCLFRSAVIAPGGIEYFDRPFAESLWP